MNDYSIFNRVCFFSVGLFVLPGLFVSSVSAQTLTVTAPSPAVTIHPGDTNVPLVVTLGPSAYSGPVSITLTGLPSGISTTPLTLTPGSSGTLLINATVTADQEAFPAISPQDPDSSTTTVTLLAFAGTISATTGVSFTVSLENPGFAPAAGKIDLPIVSINTNGVGINDKTTDVPGTITITSADGSVSYLPGLAGPDNTATFHLHGNTTALMPKKPFHVKLNTSVDLLHGMGLDCGYVTGSGASVCDKSKSYILLANYDDKTLLRDWAASALANAIPSGGSYLNSAPGSPTPSGTAALLPWAPHSLFVELYLNGQYEGSYQLIEDIKLDSHRVNIDEMENSDVSGKSLTGGYLMEIDNRQAEDFVFVTPQNVYVGLEDPDFSPEVPEQTSYIKTYVDTAEAALFSSNYTDPVVGWRAYFDQAAAINYYIVNDLMGNVDSARFFSSVYMYKDKNNPLIYMGPVWDFDLSSGNAYFGTPILNAVIPWMQNESPWYSQWFSDPGFVAAAQQQWNALKDNGVIDAWVNSIIQQAGTLQQSQKNNFARWPMQGVYVWGNAQVAGSYDGEVSYMVDWIRLREGYIDGFLNNKSASATSLSVSSSGPLQTGSPAVLTAQVTGNKPTGRVTFSRNEIIIGSASVDATGSASLTTSDLVSGPCYLDAYYSGDNANSLSAGSYGPVTILSAPAYTATNVSSSTQGSNAGDPVTLTAAVVAESGNGSGIPTGSISFSANGAAIGSATLSGTGAGTLTTSNLPVGNTTIQAVYSGDLTHLQSTSNVLTLPVQALAPHLTIAAIANHTFGDNAFPVSATSDSSGAITYNVLSGPAMISGNVVTLTGAGSVVVGASQVAAGNYGAGAAQASFNIAKAIATLSFSSIASHTFGDPAFAVSASSQATGVVTFSVVSGPASISGDVVKLTGAGTVTLNASQVADSNYLAANAQISFTVAPEEPVLSFATIPAHTFGDAPFTVAATSASTGTVSYSVLSGPATISDQMITLTGGGLVTIGASQAANGNYTATTAETSFTVERGTATLTFAAIPAHTYGDVSFAVSATSLSTGAVSYSVVSGPATVSGNMVTLTGAGTVVLGASQAADTNYVSASAQTSLSSAKQAAKITITHPTAAVPGQAVVLSASVMPAITGMPTGTIIFMSDGVALGAAAPISNGVATYSTTALLSGSHAITATYSGDVNFLTANGTGSTIVVAPLDFSLTLTSSSTATIVFGSSATYTFQVAALYGSYPGTVNLSVSGLPAQVTGTFSPSTIAADGGTQTVTLTVQTLSHADTRSSGSRLTPIVLAFLLLPMIGTRRMRRSGQRAGYRTLSWLLLLAGLATASTVCGCGSQKSPQNYPLTITASSGTVQHTSDVTLSVQ